VATAGTHIAKQAAAGPPGWVSAAISAAAVATIIGVSLFSGVKKGNAEAQ
jgi:hypothetical protein